MYADKKELIELCRVAARYKGSYVTHIRGEGDTLLESIHEALEIGEASGIPIHISHLKSRGRANWGKSKEALDMIDGARSRTMDVTADQYPYKAGSSTLTSLLPPWVLEGGNEKLLERLRKPELRQRIKRELETGLPGWEGGMRDIGWGNVRVSYCRKNKDLEGKSLEEIAQMRGVDTAEALFDLLIEEDAVASMVIFHMSEEDVRTIMRHPAVNVCTDGLILGKPHPRLYGSFARVLGRYVREERVLTLEEAVRKMTSLPAQRLGLADRGLIAEGMYADITIFDPQSVIDRATFEVPQQYPEGIRYVIVNGVVTVDNGEHIKALAGRVLRKGVTLSS
ncbi:MAG: amidohydrolase family protein [Nitrososphaeria archaeon]|nr:amidohydrolase family protein [Nitrososphaeria archaeon]NIQ33375.1 amidohydrolase family protein [Nitrososphaeria archaeon]